MRLLKILQAAVGLAGAGFLVACTPVTATTSSTTATTATTTTTTTSSSSSLSFTMDSPSATQIEGISNSSRSLTLTLELGSTPHDVYLAFVNKNLTQSASVPTITTSAKTIAASVETADSEAPVVTGALRDLPFQGSLPMPSAGASAGFSTVQTLSRSTASSTTAASSAYAVGDTKTYHYFTYDDTDTPSGSATATLAVQVSNATQNRILNVWIAGSTTTTAQAQLLADQFLASSGTGSDIYSWVTGIFGREYYEPGIAVTTSDGLTPVTPTGEINIVLADLNPNRADQDSYVYGYFYAVNNFTTYVYNKVEYSNASLAFFLDGPSMTDDEEGIVSTLGHEFQHMINFYSKYLVNGAGQTDTWIDEMCSMVAEDLIADKLGIPGPRGVPLASGAFDYTAGALDTNATSDRLGLFNRIYPSYSLTNWSDTVYDYSMAYSFGSWLARNYGGPTLFRAIVANGYTDETAVTAAVTTATGLTVDFTTLLREWGAAVLASTSGQTEYLNLIQSTGATETAFPFTLASAVTGETQSWALGSIDYFRYYAYGKTTAGPLLSPSATMVQPAGLYFVQAGSSLTGTQTLTVTLSTKLDVSVIAKVTP